MEHTGVATYRLPPASEPVPWGALREFGRGLAGAVRAVVLTGPAGAFAPPADPADDAARARGREDAVAWLRRPDLVSLAAIRGPARDDGVALALACDLRVCAADTDLALDAPRIGALCGLGVLDRLEMLVGYPRALELVLTGRRMRAAEAAAIGVVNLVVGVEDVDAAAADLLAALLSVPRTVVTEIKTLLSPASSSLRTGTAGRAAAEAGPVARLVQERHAAP